MKTIKVNLPRSLDKVKIVTLADLHIGDKYCDLKLVKSWIDEIKNNEDMYCILNGDLMNNAIKSSVSNVYEDVMTPKQQLHYVREMLEPIKDKILLITTGNHEIRTDKETDISLMEHLSIMLDLEDKYSNEGAVIVLRVGEIKGSKTTNQEKPRQVVYTMYVTHGSGGARMTNAATSLSPIIDVDIYIHSHTHQPDIKYSAMYRVDTKNNTTNKFDKMFVVTGSTLDYGGYAQIKKYIPSSNRNPIIILDGRKKYFNQYM